MFAFIDSPAARGAVSVVLMMRGTFALPFLGLLLLALSGPTNAQFGLPLSPAPAEAPSVAPTVEQLLTDARRELAAVEAELEHLTERVNGADDRIATIRAQLASGEDIAGVADIDIESMSRSALEELIAAQRSLVDEHRARIQELDAILSALIQAPAQSPAESPISTTSDDRRRPAENGSTVGTDDVGGEGIAKPEDLDAALQSTRRAIAAGRAELARVTLANAERLNALATTERDFQRRALEQREAFIERAVERLRQLRDEEASRSLDEAREARRQTAFEPPALREIADEIFALKEELAEVSRRGGVVAEQMQATSTRLDRMTDSFVTTRQRVEVVGSTPAIGRMLRRRLATLPSNIGYTRSARERRIEISEMIDRQIDIDEELRQLGDLNVEVDRLLDSLDGEVSEEEQARLRARFQELLTDKRNTLGEVHAQYGSVAARLTQLDTAQRELVARAREFVAFIAGALMTIPSQSVLHGVPGQAWMTAVGNLFDANLWLGLARDSVGALSFNFGYTMLVVIVALLLFFLRRYARREILRIAPLTRRIRTDNIRLTLVTLLFTVLLASFLPVLLGGIGWIIHRAAVSDLSSSLGGALMRVALVLFVVDYLRQMVRPEGLAMRHFRWTEETCRRIGRNLYWFLPLAVVVVGITRFTFLSGVEGWNQFSRLAFLTSLVLLVVFVRRVTRYRKVHERSEDALTEINDPLVQTSRRWFVLLLALLLFTGVVSYLGYHYTAMRLDHYFGWTVALGIVLLVSHNLLMRWSTLVQKRLRFNELLRRREELRASREAQEGGEPGEAGEPPIVEEKELDVVGLGDQARRVVSAALVFFGLVGLYLIWEELFPALRILDEIALPFSRGVLVDGEHTLVPVSVTDLGVALLVFVATFIGARNLPGLLEFVLLQRLPIDAGARYATITIARYIIIAVGVITGFGLIGADWSKLQWLIAALGVGLGFGLQEIVANFVSGIILLFERPIRVGDTITLGDTDGVVTRIRIRATTIRNWDQKELVVPNKEFITGRLLNWTLSDPINRMVIRVGVAYGSDVDKALAIMLDVATRHPHVLDDPKPSVVFEGFGDSSLDLSVRCYQSGLEWRLVALSEINSEINRRFAEAGIEIPFPQRDVNFNGKKPLHVIVDSSS